MSDYGMSVRQLGSSPGQISARFDWNYDCLQTSFDGQTEFEILAIVDDYDFCLFAYPDTLKMNLNIILPDNTFPDIFSEDLGDRNENYFILERKLLQRVYFDVFAEDLDNDPIFIDGIGSNFDLKEMGFHLNLTLFCLYPIFPPKHDLNLARLR